MADVFISYSTSDQDFANYIYNQLVQHNLSVFLAPISTSPGEKWNDVIIETLKQSDWVLFLASHKACNSPFVLQEIGIAIGTNKSIIPIVWDLNPGELPGWSKNYQAINLKNQTADFLIKELESIAKKIKSKKGVGLLIVGALLAGLFIILSEK